MKFMEEQYYKKYLEWFKKKFDKYPDDMIKDSEKDITGGIQISVINKLLSVRANESSIINNKLNILTFDEYKSSKK